MSLGSLDIFEAKISNAHLRDTVPTGCKSGVGKIEELFPFSQCLPSGGTLQEA
jgi:hypothetical protein